MCTLSQTHQGKYYTFCERFLLWYNDISRGTLNHQSSVHYLRAAIISLVGLFNLHFFSSAFHRNLLRFAFYVFFLLSSVFVFFKHTHNIPFCPSFCICRSVSPLNRVLEDFHALGVHSSAFIAHHLDSFIYQWRRTFLFGRVCEESNRKKNSCAQWAERKKYNSRYTVNRKKLYIRKLYDTTNRLL